MDIYLSTDGTFGGVPDFTFSSFDQTDNGPTGGVFSASDTILIPSSGITDVRMDFFNGTMVGFNNPWVFLEEITFEAIPKPSAKPEPSTFALAALGLLSLGMIGRRRRSR